MEEGKEDRKSMMKRTEQKTRQGTYDDVMATQISSRLMKNITSSYVENKELNEETIMELQVIGKVSRKFNYQSS